MEAVARISRLFGTDGGVLLALYDNFPSDFTTDDPLFVMAENLPVPLWCVRFELHGARGAKVVFADLDTEKRIGEFIGRELYAENAEMPDDEFVLEELIGFEVTAGDRHGRITDYYDNDVNPLFGITFDGREECLVPAAEEFIAGIDFDRRHIRMVLPDGLIDL